MFTVPIPPAPFDRGRATALVAQKKIAAADTGWSYWITAKQATTRSNDTQAKMNMFAPARPKADSTTPASVEQATDSFTQKRAPGIPTATADAIPSFEDRVIQLQEYYDVHGHLRVPKGYRVGRRKDSGVW
jgi:hypothetical protein